VSDAETTARLRERMARDRMAVEALVQAERWEEVADVARALARGERELAMAGDAPKVTGADARRRFVRG
jgi:hypothetical protein